ncbi:serine hydrolase domain-containing protein [Luteimonas lutimaris]|uniref:Beta-lactamase-related domain-containing protein n=1 Tax=Luteimonas lutimaris TaxID=698645 RepID=A0ABP7M3Y6_9GAMM
MLLRHAIAPVVLLLALAAGLPASAADLPPAAQAALDHLLDKARSTHSAAVLVLRDGKPVGRYDRDGKPPGAIELMSATKSVVALGIGQLLADGRIRSLDQPVADFYPEWKQGLKADVTVRMLLDHTSGMQNVPMAPEEIYPAPDIIQLALAADLDSAPGEAFSYNNKAVNLLAGIIREASGQPMDVFFRDGLFKAMDIHPGPWEKDRTGHPYAMSGLPLTATDAAKIGQLVLDRGKWEGRQLVPADYIDAMLAASPKQSGCGLLWWRRTAWTKIHVAADAAGRMRDRGVSDAVAAKFEALQDRTFDSEAAFLEAISGAFGASAAEAWNMEIKPKIPPNEFIDSQDGPVVAFEAEGYLGQYIEVVPGARLVAVRQIAERDDYQPDWEYATFRDDVIALARALDPALVQDAP